ncbi:MAG: SDR family oxidoreductase [Anaerolineaceae bacterium]
MTRYLVTGASGLLGLNMSLWLSQTHTVIGAIRQPELTGAPFEVVVTDLAEKNAAESLVEHAGPDIIIHCAAMAIVDDCESQPELAQNINGDLPGELAALAAKHSIPMVHISTDAVFDGEKGNYKEDDVPHPLSVYARTKLAGEQAVTSTNSQAIIARVNFYGFSLHGQRSLGEFFVNNLAAGKPVNGFTDVQFCPLFVLDLASILIEMVEKHLHGLYHVVSSESLSKYDFAVRIARKFGLDEHLVTPISVLQGGLKAARSPNLTLNTGKLQAALGHSTPDQEAGFEAFHQIYRNGYVKKLMSYASQN